MISDGFSASFDVFWPRTVVSGHTFISTINLELDLVILVDHGKIFFGNLDLAKKFA